MSLLTKKLRYGVRVHPTLSDYGVPLDTMQTDDYDEFIEYVKGREREGLAAKWRCPGEEYAKIYEDLYGEPPSGDFIEQKRYPKGWNGRANGSMADQNIHS